MFLLQTLLLFVFGFFTLYLTALSILALGGRKRGSLVASHQRKFALVIPAHNEELAIAKTIRSLLAIDYPHSLFDLIVVADNCNDKTADIARSLGVIVYEREDHIHGGKGYALRWCFERLLTRQPGYDAMAVIDADSAASGNFLVVMNSYLERGAPVIQCSDVVEPSPGAWSAEMTRIGFLLYNYVRPMGRRVIGCSAGLRGNGMCFRTEALRTVPWEAYSLAEDLEYGMQLLLHGIPVTFAPEATVLATMPHDPENAQSQRARWEGGRFPIIRKYSWPLLRAALSQRSYKLFDSFIDLVTPALVNLIGAALFMSLLSLLLQWLGVSGMSFYALLWLVVVALGLIHMLTGLYVAGADRSTYLALLYLPRYALWKLRLYLKMIRSSKTNDWVRTAREASTVK